ncbi:MFS transporter [Mycobacterium sp.]|uniref:MFS transporter n=1 Tax=Mycobacterium sp. TaxID=1785 RepID=UPI003BB16995
MTLFADTTPLRNPEFRRLWVAAIPTVVGANLTMFAVPVQLYALTGSSMYFGLAGVFALVPLVVFGLLGGAWADAMDRRILLIVASSGLAVSSVLLWLQAALSFNNVWVLLCLLAVQQGFFAVNVPTRSAAIPRLLPADQLPAANSLYMIVMRAGAIVGPLLAGIVVSWVDLSTVYLIDAVTCLTSVWAAFRLAPMPTGAPALNGTGSSRWGVVAVLDGFRYLLANKVVLTSFVVDLIAVVLGLPRALFPQMAHESFGGPVQGGTTMALLAAAIPVGAVVGGMYFGWFSRIRRQGLAIIVAIAAWGVGILGFGLTSGLAHGRAGPLLWIALAFLAFGGAADMVSAALRSTILQQAASDELRGRLQGAFLVVIVGGQRLADAVHGGAAPVVGTTAATAGGGALVLVGMLIVALAAPAFVRYRPR